MAMEGVVDAQKIVNNVYLKSSDWWLHSPIFVCILWCDEICSYSFHKLKECMPVFISLNATTVYFLHKKINQRWKLSQNCVLFQAKLCGIGRMNYQYSFHCSACGHDLFKAVQFYSWQCIFTSLLHLGNTHLKQLFFYPRIPVGRHLSQSSCIETLHS